MATVTTIGTKITGYKNSVKKWVQKFKKKNEKSSEETQHLRGDKTKEEEQQKAQDKDDSEDCPELQKHMERLNSRKLDTILEEPDEEEAEASRPWTPPIRTPLVQKSVGESSSKRGKVKKAICKKITAQWNKLKNLMRWSGKEDAEEKEPNRRPEQEGTEEKKPNRTSGKETMRDEKPNRRPGKETLRDEKPKRSPPKETGRDQTKGITISKYVYHPQQYLTYYEAPDKDAYGKMDHNSEGNQVRVLNTVSKDLNCSENYAAFEGLCAKKVIEKRYKGSNLREDAVEFLNVPGGAGAQRSVLKFQVLKKASEKWADYVVMMNQIPG